MDQAIGVIDSGVGGLTVVQELLRQLPNERLIYLGDTKRCPYGPRTGSEVKRFTWEMVDFLMEQEIKTLVVACNTATAFTLPSLQEELKIPVIGVIQPGARAAIKSTLNDHVGVIGTEGTISSQAYVHALKRIKTDIIVESLACPSFVPLVEQGILSGESATEVVKEALQSLKGKEGMDSLILGCTHYPLIKDLIQEEIGAHVNIVSSSEETARETSTILDVHHLLYRGKRIPRHQFYTTGDLQVFEKMMQRIFNHSADELEKITCNKVILNRRE